MKEEKKKHSYIFIKYAANPDWPEMIRHMDKRISRLTLYKTRKFDIKDYKEAWKFLLECTSPSTDPLDIIWAFPDKEAFDILQAMDELQEKPKKFKYESLDTYDAYFGENEIILTKREREEDGKEKY